MNGYGLFVWSSFLITFLACAFVYYKTYKTLKKYEREFAKESATISKTNNIELINLINFSIQKKIFPRLNNLNIMN